MDFEEMKVKDVIKMDIENVAKEILEPNRRSLEYNKDACAWFIDGEEIVDLLWYDCYTIIHPKEIIGYIEEYIEDVMKIESNSSTNNVRMERKLSNIDEEILYWTNYFGYEEINCHQLIKYIKEHFIKTQKEVVIEYVELMCININDIFMLDWDYVCEHDNDYVEIAPGKFLNIFLLEDAEEELVRNGLVN